MTEFYLNVHLVLLYMPLLLYNIFSHDTKPTRFNTAGIFSGFFWATSYYRLDYFYAAVPPFGIFALDLALDVKYVYLSPVL